MDEQGSKAMENWVKIQQCLQYNNIVSVFIYTLLFGNSDHLHGDVFHTVPGKKRK